MLSTLADGVGKCRYNGERVCRTTSILHPSPQNAVPPPYCAPPPENVAKCFLALESVHLILYLHMYDECFTMSAQLCLGICSDDCQASVLSALHVLLLFPVFAATSHYCPVCPHPPPLVQLSELSSLFGRARFLVDWGALLPIHSSWSVQPWFLHVVHGFSCAVDTFLAARLSEATLKRKNISRTVQPNLERSKRRFLAGAPVSVLV